MSFTPDQNAALSAALDRANVASRQQAGQTLSYIEAWHAIAEANRIFGFDGWNRETVELRQLGEPRTTQDRYGKDQMRVGYSARVRITVMTSAGSMIVREGCGVGCGIDKDVDQAHESAIKEAESDAMKRALMTFGNPFGLALYDKTQANVAKPEHPALAEGREAAARGMTALTAWWGRLDRPAQAALKPVLDSTLKPAAEKADAFPGDTPFDQQKEAA